MSDIPVLTKTNAKLTNCQVAVDVSEVLTVFNEAVSFTGESLTEMSSTLKKTLGDVAKANKAKPAADIPQPKQVKAPAPPKPKPVPVPPQKTKVSGIIPPDSGFAPSTPSPSESPESPSDRKKFGETQLGKKMGELGKSLKGFGTSISSSILGDTSFITQPFKQIGDITKKAFSVFKSDKTKGRVPPRRDVLMRKGVEGASAVYLGDMIKKHAGDGKGEDDGGFNLLEKLGLAGVASTLFPALMKALPFAMIAGGILWGVLDGIWAVGQAENWGVSEVSAAMAGFLAGKGEGWDNALKNAGKGALIGGGIGLAAGGPIGMLVGALLGAAVFGILGYFGPEKVAKFIDDRIMKNTGLLTLIGGVVGAGIGLAIGGPVGLLVGGMLGMALGGLGEALASEDPKAKALELVKDPKVLATFGAILGGGIGLMVGGPIGAVIGAVLGFAGGAIASALIDEKEKTGKTIKQILFDSIIQPMITFFQGIGDWFAAFGAIWNREKIGADGVGFGKMIVDAGTFLTGIDITAASGERVRDVVTRSDLTRERDRMIKKRDAEEAQREKVQDEIQVMWDAFETPEFSAEAFKELGDLRNTLVSSIESLDERIKFSTGQLERRGKLSGGDTARVGMGGRVDIEGYDIGDFGLEEIKAVPRALPTDISDEEFARFRAMSTEERSKELERYQLEQLIRNRERVMFNIGVGTSGSIGLSDEAQPAGFGGGPVTGMFDENDALITSDGKIVRFHPDDNIIATKNDAAVIRDIESVKDSTKANNLDNINRIMEGILDKINAPSTSTPVFQTNHIRRYDPKNIMESMAVAIP